jgi:hypothetical protein
LITVWLKNLHAYYKQVNMAEGYSILGGHVDLVEIGMMAAVFHTDTFVEDKMLASQDEALVA